MPRLKFCKDQEILKQLSDAQSAVDQYAKSHSGRFSEAEHKEYRKLLKNKAEALSRATGMQIHSLFEEE